MIETENNTIDCTPPKLGKSFKQIEGAFRRHLLPPLEPPYTYHNNLTATWNDIADVKRETYDSLLANNKLKRSTKPRIQTFFVTTAKEINNSFKYSKIYKKTDKSTFYESNTSFVCWRLTLQNEIYHPEFLGFKKLVCKLNPNWEPVHFYTLIDDDKDKLSNTQDEISGLVMGTKSLSVNYRTV